MLSRELALARLRAIARDHDGVAGAEQVRRSPRVYAALLHHFGTLDAARVAANVAAPELPRVWSRDRVISELQELHRAGVRITTKELSRHGARGLVNAAHDLFGGLPAARKAAKIPAPPRRLFERVRWDEDAIVSDIRALRREGRSLAASRAPEKLVQAAIYHLGSWRAAVETAGFDYDAVRLIREPWTRNDLLDHLRTVARRKPKAMLAELHRDPAAEALVREFGSIEAAAQAANLHGWPARRLEPLASRREVIARIRGRRGAGLSIRSHAVETNDSHLYRSALRRFGSWDAAVVATGETPVVRRRWTKTAVLDALRARRRAGLSNTPKALRDDASGLYQAAKRELGFDADLAAERFGAERLYVHWTRELVIEALREGYARGERNPPARVRLAATQLFGSMNAARDAAGVPIFRTSWDRDRVVREIRALDGARPSPNLVNAAQRLFGSWSAARRTAENARVARKA